MPAIALAAAHSAPDNPVFETQALDQLHHFRIRSEQLGRLGRSMPDGGEDFFREALKRPFGIAGRLNGVQAGGPLRTLLGQTLDPASLKDPFFDQWIEDIQVVARFFAEFLGADDIGLSLGTHRGCRRYHMDRVPYRLLVTYYGTGTEWLPPAAADRAAYEAGAPNEQILMDPRARQYLEAWDVAIFRGLPDGLLHRTPDSALDHPSLLLRLDHPSFWDHPLSIVRQH